MTTWTTILTTLLAGGDLTAAESAWAMTQIVRGEATPVQLAAYLVALRAKGETAVEVAGAADALLAHAVPVTLPGPAVDIVGTGGDGTGAVNISTMAAIVVAATGLTVVKHGGRAASSTSAGSGDVIERLGIPLDLPPAQVAKVAERAGITYLFAPAFHAGMRHAGPVRRELGVPTIFNVLAPLINPARPAYALVGVADPRFVAVLAYVLAARGCQALVVRGDDGLDKLSTSTVSQVVEVRDGQVRHTVLDPQRFGIARSAPGALRGGDAAANAAVVHALVDGDHGPVRDAVLLNAAAACATTDADGDLDDRIAAALLRCADAIDTGAAASTLQRWIGAATS
ncbi:anthranilate phosphoribosyltransferase [Catellatospora citrea]|uniref:Anthranilate phosphoribosyltransferase n=1 Tax=Catellatospora citrea TaxID=53366 RepID=A0A8J3K7J0_9ACTN|nr:anthranilate phosphoribosyltransferase [Catellatospora citrea]RKE00461.1 anthranilate phosphoribosyltransferase [Catellatospora citrea]GIF98121.1 anthranilate phosphoribosyltransferase [Catellatospora citrea]